LENCKSEEEMWQKSSQIVGNFVANLGDGLKRNGVYDSELRHLDDAAPNLFDLILFYLTTWTSRSFVG
jgi:hypothetical protein